MAEAKKYPHTALKRNVHKDLFKQWQRAKRDGDTTLLVKELGVSRPVIENALIRGYANKKELIESINNFFIRREIDEQKAAEELADALDNGKK